MKKERRQNYILDIIKNKKINTQKELYYELTDIGIHTTQATISRDIKELNIVKFQNKDGESQYKVMESVELTEDSKLKKIFNIALLSISEFKSNILIRTLDKAAGICSDYIRELKIDGIEACLFSDDTVLVLIKNGYDTYEIIDKLEEAIND